MTEQVILITGTRKGIGKYLAEYFLSLGHKVAGCSRNVSEIAHANYIHKCLDVSDEKMVIDFVREVKTFYGRIDVLINNAGIAAMNHMLTIPTKTVNAIFQTNFMGAFLFSREVAKIMVRQKHGRIINFSTVAVPLSLNGEMAYAASKAAVVKMTEIAAKELAPYGITVNAVGPTPVLTDLIKNIPEDKIKNLLGMQALKRFGTVEDVRNVIEFYINDKSNFITGQTIYLGGVIQ